jgi:hypothetical protein
MYATHGAIIARKQRKLGKIIYKSENYCLKGCVAV